MRWRQRSSGLLVPEAPRVCSANVGPAFFGSAGGPAAYRYWRLNITANDGSTSFTSLSEVELLQGTTDHLDNVSGLSDAGSSSNNGSDFAVYTADDNQDTEWVTASGSHVPSWISWDTKAARVVERYSLRSQRVVTGRTPTSWQLQANNVGFGASDPWVTIHTVSGSTGWGIKERREFTI